MGPRRRAPSTASESMWPFPCPIMPTFPVCSKPSSAVEPKTGPHHPRLHSRVCRRVEEATLRRLVDRRRRSTRDWTCSRSDHFSLVRRTARSKDRNEPPHRIPANQDHRRAFREFARLNLTRMIRRSFPHQRISVPGLRFRPGIPAITPTDHSAPQHFTPDRKLRGFHADRLDNACPHARNQRRPPGWFRSSQPSESSDFSEVTRADGLLAPAGPRILKVPPPVLSWIQGVLCRSFGAALSALHSPPVQCRRAGRHPLSTPRRRRAPAHASCLPSCAARPLYRNSWPPFSFPSSSNRSRGSGSTTWNPQSVSSLTSACFLAILHPPADLLDEARDQGLLRTSASTGRLLASPTPQ